MPVGATGGGDGLLAVTTGAELEGGAVLDSRTAGTGAGRVAGTALDGAALDGEALDREGVEPAALLDAMVWTGATCEVDTDGRSDGLVVADGGNNAGIAEADAVPAAGEAALTPAGSLPIATASAAQPTTAPTLASVAAARPTANHPTLVRPGDM